MIRIFKIFIFLSFINIVNGQSEYIYVLGNVQDAGLPHIGCKHKFCKDKFNEFEEYFTTSIAIVDPVNEKYILFEATPDLPHQLNYLEKKIFKKFLLPESIFITHAHIGHYAGLMYFGREALGSNNVNINVLPKMANFLKTNGPWSQLVEINNINIKKINFDKTTYHLENISVLPIKVPHRDEYSETAAYEIVGKNKKALFIPDIDKWEKWTKNIIQLVQEFDYLLLDATFYDSNEINRDISEIPHPLVIETISLLDNLSNKDKSKVYFIHMNHTNMMLDSKSDLSEYVISKGFNIARLGLKLEL